MQQEQRLPDDIEQLLQRFNELEGHEENGQGTEDDAIEEIDVYFVRRPKKGEEDTEQVIESTLQQRPRRNIPVASFVALAVNIILFLCVLIFAILPQLTANVTITLIPVEKQVSSTVTIFAVEGAPRSDQIHARFLPSFTLTQSKSVLATGHGHQNAQQAQGTITFYNGLFESQTVAAGTILTGADGVQVITDQLAIIPAATPPNLGQATVPAHTVQTGSQGNILAYNINTSCCLTAVKAVNITAFRGGANERKYPSVTKADISTAAQAVTTTVTASENAALQAQLTTHEELIIPTCTPTVTSNHQPGDETASVTITVSENCTGIAYDSIALQEQATQLLTHQATAKLGTHYSLLGDVQVTVLKAAITNKTNGIATIAVRGSGTWVYQINEQQVKNLIAGKPRHVAIHTLFTLPGIQRVTIAGIPDNQQLPEDPTSIHLLILYGAS